MKQLERGDIIYAGGKEYMLLDDARGKAGIWTSPVEVSYEDEEKMAGGKEKYFLKFTEKGNSLGEKLLKRENGFRMNYPYIGHICGDFVGHDKEGNKVYCVLAEYIEGLDLVDFREQSKHLDHNTMFRYMMQMLYGVRYYCGYTKNDPYAHRDLKPANIMVDLKRDKCVIVDFDLAHVSSSTATQKEEKSINGTPGFSDPRAWETNMTDQQMDIYGLGRTFFYWITGRPYFYEKEQDGPKGERYYDPIREELAYSFYEDRLTEEYREPEYRELRRILAKMTAAPAERYQTILEVIKDMKAFLISYYGGVRNYQKVFQEKEVLRMPEDWYLEEGVTFGIRMNGRRLATTLVRNQMYEVQIQKETVMTLYNLDGKLYYIPISPELTKEKEDGTYRIKDKDQFCYRDIDIDVRL